MKNVTLDLKIAAFLFALPLFLMTPCHAKDILNTEKNLYAQGSEELAARDFFEDKRGGFFVDIGASDAIDINTTYYLEKHLGWHGIAVDAQKEFGESYLKNRPNTKFLCYAITDRSGGTIDLFLGGKWDSQVATITEHGKQYLHGTVVARPVPAITMNDLLDHEGIKSIDFLSIDIEDAEPQALAGFDIQRFKPKLVCIEAHSHVQGPIKEYFAKNGYERIEKYSKLDNEQNWYFKPKKSHTR